MTNPDTHIEQVDDWKIDGSIYDGFEAALTNGDRTVAHVFRYGDAVALLSAISQSASIAALEARVEDAELALALWDSEEDSEYWLRHRTLIKGS